MRKIDLLRTFLFTNADAQTYFRCQIACKQQKLLQLPWVEYIIHGFVLGDKALLFSIKMHVYRNDFLNLAQ